jgi:hypothetical protein
VNPKLDWTLIATKDYISHLYWSQQMTVQQTARFLGVGNSTLIRRMKLLGIPRRKCSDQKRWKNSIHKQILALPGWETMRWKEVAQKIGCSLSAVNRAKTHFNKKIKEKEQSNDLE